jgi:phosphoribosylformylglycinamidine cyclo-ligase
MSKNLTYSKAGVDIDIADATKKEMAKSITGNDVRVLNRFGAFASLVEGGFAKIKNPVLVLKTEEPGSKQKLAFQYNRAASIAYDLINHLVNDIIVMGAEPLYVMDCIICGKIEPEVVQSLVEALASACREQGCVLVGGETSEQPGVVEAGLYILSANIVGVVEKDRIIDGSKIAKNDVVLAVASNGLHTNGYSLVRALIKEKPALLKSKVEGKSFLNVILQPHKCYGQEFRDLFRLAGLKGFAHITGGGIEGNLNRILPDSKDALIDRDQIKILPVFKFIRKQGQVPDVDMARTFNLGVGMTIVCAPDIVDNIVTHLRGFHCECYPIGKIVEGSGKVQYQGEWRW